MLYFTRLCVCLFLFLLYSGISVAQERPKIGLVLSGGGAKGLAHIGVLKILEDAGIVPDYITGTSMGSIVGGLYALGYSADQLDSIVQAIDWDAVLTNKVPLDEIAIEEKEFYGRFIAELPVEGIKVGLPRGIIEGQKLSELLSNLTRAAHDIEDFSQLPIPFACVAADIETGEPVLLNRGSLPEALRASMAIPSVFTPVSLDGRLLVDGGLVRNFPVQEVIDMGADIVIGVFVSTDLYKRDKLNSMIDVLSQSAFVMSAFDTREQRKLVDVYLAPELEKYSTGSFNQAEEIVDQGELKALEYRDRLREVADSVLTYGPMHEVLRLPLRDTFKIQSIRVMGNEKISSDLIAGKLRISEGMIISLDQIEARIALLYGTRYFDKVLYEIVQKPAGTELVVKVEESTNGSLKLAAHYDSENDVGLNVNLTYRNLLIKSSRAIFELDFAKNPRLFLNFLKYIGKRQNSAFSLGFEYTDYDLPFFEEGEAVATFDNNYTNLYGQWQLTSSKDLTFGTRLQLELSKLQPKVADNTARIIERIWNRNWNILFFFNKNTLNKQFFPSKGMNLYVGYKQVVGLQNRTRLAFEDSIGTGPVEETQFLDNFWAVEGECTYIFEISPKVSLITKNSMVISGLQEIEFNINDAYFIGGFNPRFINNTEYWGAKEKEYINPNYFYSRLEMQYQPWDNWYLNVLINYIDVEYPMQWLYPNASSESMDGRSRRVGYGVSVGFNSMLGPMILSVAKDQHRDDVLVNLNLGFWF